MNLYEWKRQIESSITMDPDTGEINFDEALVEELTNGFNDKVENICLWVKDMSADVVAIKSEETALAARRKTLEKKIESLKTYLSGALDGQKFSTPRCEIGWRKSTKVEIDESLLPDQYWDIEYKASASRAKADLKAGKEVPGARLVENLNMSIK